MINESITSYRSANLLLDLGLGVIKNTSGESQRLSPVNLKLLTCLLERPHELVSRADIFDYVWPNQVIGDDVLTRAVSDIRAQLAKLDAKVKYIETLPKRGYRWTEKVELVQVELIEAGLSLPAPGNLAAQQQKVSAGKSITTFLAPIVAGLVLAVILMWSISQPAKPQLSLAVLPAVVDSTSLQIQAKAVDRQILQTLLRNNANVELLSGAAIATRPSNPFPYFYKEFGASAVLDVRLNESETGMVVELNLIDARTGLEIRSISVSAINSADLLVRLAKVLEYDWWQD